MCEKKKLLEESMEVMQKVHVQVWYRNNLEGKNQYYTIQRLREGVRHGHLSISEALCIALVVGLQWNVKFEGVP